MSTTAVPIGRFCGSKSTSTNTSISFPYPELLEMIAKEIYVVQKDWYDDQSEVPSASLTKKAAMVIGSANVSVEGVEITPYFGEIHLTWKDKDNGRKVIAMFGPDNHRTSLYWEQKTGNRVTEHHVIQNPTGVDFRHQVEWCCNALVNV